MNTDVRAQSGMNADRMGRQRLSRRGQRTSWRPVAGLALAAIALACSSVMKAAFAQPVVTLRDVRLANLGLEGGTFQVVLSVYNPNEFNLDASSVSYAVLVDSTEVGNGKAEQRIVIAALDSGEVKLPLHISWATAGPAGQVLMRGGSVLYEVKGEMRIASGVGTITLPYDQRGRFSAMGAR